MQCELGFINDIIEELPIYDPKYFEWEANNMLVMSWILNVEPNISEGLYSLNTVK